MANKWFNQKQPESSTPGSQPQSETQQDVAAETIRQGADAIKTPSPSARFGIYAESLMEQKMQEILHGDFKNAAEDMRRDILPYALAYTLRHLDRKISAIHKELGL